MSERPRFVPVDQLESLVGTEVGISDWLVVDQDRINQFAEVTEDRQFIHVDPEAAAKTPFGTTIAHGFLTLSLLSKFAASGTFALEDVKMGVNYGFDKVRMMSPVKSGARVRGRFSLMSADEKLPGQWTLKYGVRVEIENDEKPALAAEWVVMQFV